LIGDDTCVPFLFLSPEDLKSALGNPSEGEPHNTLPRRKTKNEESGFWIKKTPEELELLE